MPTMDGQITAATDRPWDDHFRRWIAEAEARGTDPNDVGDEDWADDPLREALERHYLPCISRDAVVLELGPGTGRLTRHVIARCRRLVLVDYSAVACEWLAKYLRGRGDYEIVQIDQPAIPSVRVGSIDAILANGVFEHLDPEEMLWFLLEFRRVLRPGGKLAFNFDNIMTDEGLAWLRKWSREPGRRCIFRFYHPEMVRRLGESAGLEVSRISCSASRFAYAELRRPE